MQPSKDGSRIEQLLGEPRALIGDFLPAPQPSKRMSDDELRARLDRGDISALNPGEASLDAQYAIETPYIPLVTSQAFTQKNTEIVLPQIQAALEGNRSAQEFYLSHRVIALGALPEWARKHIVEVREKEWTHVHFDSSLLEALAKKGAPISAEAQLPLSHIRLSLQFPDQVQSEVHNRCQLTFASARATLEEFQRSADLYVNISRGEIVRQGLLEILSNITDSHGISLGMAGPIGDRFRHFQLLHAAICTRARIIDDFALYHGLDFSDAVKTRFLTGISTNPFDLANSSFARDILPVAAGIQTQLGDRSLEERKALFETCLLDKKPLGRFHREVGRLTVKPAQAPSSSTEASSDVQQDLLQEDIDEKALRRLAVRSAIEAHCPACSNSAEVARSLIALEKRGAAAHDEIVRRIVNGEDPNEIVAQFRARLRPAEATSAAAPARSEPVAPSEATEEEQFYTVRLHKDAQEWIDSLDPRVRIAVKNRLVRMEDGNFGDHAPALHHNKATGLFEARLHTSSGPRIYYRLEGDVIFVRGGGTKRRQSSDIERFM